MAEAERADDIQGNQTFKTAIKFRLKQGDYSRRSKQHTMTLADYSSLMHNRNTSSPTNFQDSFNITCSCCSLFHIQGIF